MQLVAGWNDLFSLPPKLRTRRLIKLAHAALEAALMQGGRTTTSTALALIELEQRNIDPVVRLAEGLSRIAEREIRRVQKAAAAGAAPADPPAGEAPPDATPSAGNAKKNRKTAGRFTQRVDAVAARLRAKIIAEQGWTAEPARPQRSEPFRRSGERAVAPPRPGRPRRPRPTAEAAAPAAETATAEPAATPSRGAGRARRPDRRGCRAGRPDRACRRLPGRGRRGDRRGAGGHDARGAGRPLAREAKDPGRLLARRLGPAVPRDDAADGARAAGRGGGAREGRRLARRA